MVATRSNTLLSPKTLQWIAIGIAVLITLALMGRDDCSATNKSCFTLLQLTINGILVGGVYGLVALGIVIINKASGVFNFAHGNMMLVGALLFWQTFAGIPSQEFSLLLAVIAATVTLSLIGGSETLPESEVKENRLQRLQRQVTSQRFLIGLGAGVVVGAIIYLILQNLEDNVDLGLFTLRADLVRGAIGALIGSMAVGLIVERFTIRPLLGQPVLAAIMMTLAVALILQGLTALFWGTQARPLPVFVVQTEAQVTRIPIGVDAEGKTIYQEIVSSVAPNPLPAYSLGTADLLGEDLRIARNLWWGFVIAILCFIMFVLFFQFTSTGLAMRAVAENQVLAESLGLRVRTILAVAWAIAATMAAIAGVIQGTGPSVGISALAIPPLAFRAFPAVLLGGLESITGALVGGIIIGVVEVLTIALVDSSAGQEFAPFLVLLVALMIRPDGLFGQRRIDRV